MDVLICNFPPMLPWYLPSAPAILLGACQYLGISADFLDINKLNYQTPKTIKDHAEYIININPKLVAFSLFSYKSQDIAKKLAEEIKKSNPNIKIIIGGSGIRTSINGELSYIEQLYNNHLIDFHCDGDGEKWWPKFLLEFFNINNELNFNNIDTPYFADYSRHDIEFYRNESKKNILSRNRLWVPVTGSRGCVRKCTFCEIHEHWKFTQRSPKNIVQEIREILKYIPDAYIHFTDSLVNGSLLAFDQLLDLLIEIKIEFPQFSWGGQFIVRKQSSEDYWKKIADSGAGLLEIGVETGSDRLRFDMKKNFYNIDLDQSLAHMKKFNISCAFLMLVGYPTETEEDFQQTIDMFDRYKSYANNVIGSVQLGYSLAIAPGTPLYTSSKTDPDMILTKDPVIWFNKKNETLTFVERMSRRQQLEDTIIKFGYSLSFDNHQAKLEAEENYKNKGNIIRLIEKQR
jgi:radical SAM superfamily enzyme YgiQ (UPF0313 family)